MLDKRTAAAPGYGAVAKGLHWVIVLLLIVQFAIAWTMPDIHRGTKPEGLIGLHLDFGIVILAVAAVRLLWRLAFPVPLLAEDVPAWQRLAARATHALLYLLLLVLPLMGWANASSRGWTVNLFGTVSLPPLVASGSRLGAELGDIHVVTAYGLLGLAGLHLAASLYHHFWLKDRILSRMLPGSD